jgi:hypothetical protein
VRRTNIVLISNDHNSQVFICVANPSFCLQVKNKP